MMATLKIDIFCKFLRPMTDAKRCYFSSSKCCLGNVAVSSGLKRIGITKGEQLSLIKQKPVQPVNPKLIKIAILGAPNAGKSTLANKIIGWRFSSVSQKVHTTRQNCLGVLTDGNTQLIFLDTPGLITPQKKKIHNLESSLLRDPHTSLFEADLIAVVHDVSTTWGSASLDKDLLATLELHKEKKAILILNKVDLVPTKDRLLSITRALTENIVQNKPISSTTKSQDEEYRQKQFLKEVFGNSSEIDQRKEVKKDTPDWLIWRSSAGPLTELEKLEIVSAHMDNKSRSQDEHFTLFKPENDLQWKEYYKRFHSMKRQLRDKRGWSSFDHVFMVSALNGDGVNEVKDFMLSSATCKPWHYHESLITDSDPLEIAKMCIREKVLNHLRKEAPYKIEVIPTHWEMDENNMFWCAFDIVCNTNRYVSAALGKNGQLIHAIAAEAKQDLMNTFKQEMSVKLTVRLRSKQKS